MQPHILNVPSPPPHQHITMMRQWRYGCLFVLLLTIGMLVWWWEGHGEEEEADGMVTAMMGAYREKERDGYEQFIPLVGRRVPTITKGMVEIKDTNGELFPTCVRDENVYPEWKSTCHVRCSGNNNTKMFPPISYPRLTTTNRDVGEVMDEILQHTWGRDPPQIDLYVRVGLCSSRHSRNDQSGLERLWYLVRSIEIFWPRFLGHVILHLNDGDDIMVSQLELRPTHSWKIVYSIEPCLPGRLHNQWSYLSLGKYTEADWVVTTDSDTLMFLPATPDMIFGHGGKLRMVVSKNFQQNMWDPAQRWFTETSSEIGHGMTSQPVVVWVPSLSGTMDWIAKQHNATCYEQVLAQYSRNAYKVEKTEAYCWMCQIVPYIATHGDVVGERVDLHSMEERMDCFQRWVAHFSFYNKDLSYDGVDHTLHDSASKLMREGLCRMLLPNGMLPAHECRVKDFMVPIDSPMLMNVTVMEFLEMRFFTYYPMMKRPDRGCFSGCGGLFLNPPGKNTCGKADTSHFDTMKKRWSLAVGKGKGIDGR